MSATQPRPTCSPSSQPRVRLLDLDPEIGSFLDPDERTAASALTLPVGAVVRDDRDFFDHLRAMHAFGAILMDGLLVHEVSLAGRVAMRLLGPGDIVIMRGGPSPLEASGSAWLPADRVRVALLDSHLVSALTRWPGLMVGLTTQLGQQMERLTTQLLISQLPRVEDRLLALMWLMAESWGRVTPAGTRVPLELTHEALGRMIGARRPTVSLALRDLADQGALIRQRDGWILLTPFPVPGGTDASPEDIPDLSRSSGSIMLRDFVTAADASVKAPEAGYASDPTLLHETVARLQAHHLIEVQRFAERAERLRGTRELCRQTRLRVRGSRPQS